MHKRYRFIIAFCLFSLTFALWRMRQRAPNKALVHSDLGAAACLLENCSTTYQLSPDGLSLTIHARECAVGDGFRRFTCSAVKSTFLGKEGPQATMSAPEAVIDQTTGFVTLPQSFLLEREGAEVRGKDGTLDLQTLHFASPQAVEVRGDGIHHQAGSFVVDFKTRSASFNDGVRTVVEGAF